LDPGSVDALIGLATVRSRQPHLASSRHLCRCWCAADRLGSRSRASPSNCSARAASCCSEGVHPSA